MQWLTQHADLLTSVSVICGFMYWLKRSTDNKIEKLEVKMNTKLDRLEEKTDSRFDKIDTRFDKVDTQLKSISDRLSRLEGRYEGQVDARSIQTQKRRRKTAPSEL